MIFEERHCVLFSNAFLWPSRLHRRSAIWFHHKSHSTWLIILGSTAPLIFPPHPVVVILLTALFPPTQGAALGLRAVAGQAHASPAPRGCLSGRGSSLHHPSAAAVVQNRSVWFLLSVALMCPEGGAGEIEHTTTHILFQIKLSQKRAATFPYF